jgi:hypothetical protein
MKGYFLFFSSIIVAHNSYNISHSVLQKRFYLVALRLPVAKRRIHAAEKLHSLRKVHCIILCFWQRTFCSNNSPDGESDVKDLSVREIQAPQ